MGGEEPSRHLVGQIVLLRGTASVRIWYFMLIYTQPAACHCSYSFFFLSFFPVLFTCSYTNMVLMYYVLVCTYFLQQYLRLSLSLPPTGTCQIRGHIRSRLFSPTHYGSCLAFLSREDFSPFFPRRLASNCAYSFSQYPRCYYL